LPAEELMLAPSWQPAGAQATPLDTVERLVALLQTGALAPVGVVQQAPTQPAATERSRVSAPVDLPVHQQSLMGRSRPSPFDLSVASLDSSIPPASALASARAVAEFVEARGAGRLQHQQAVLHVRPLPL
jgi:hypothetical protein